MFTLRIAKLGNHPTVNFAVNELARYLKLIDKRLPTDQRTTDRYDAENDRTLYVGLCDKVAQNSLDDEILIDVKNGVGIITGASERAVLIAVYRFLRELGCRFIRPGPDGDIIPKRTVEAAFLTSQVHETPSRRLRCICIEGGSLFEHVYNVLDWIPKMGMNSYFVQFFVPSSFQRLWYGHKYDPFVSPEPVSEEESEGYRDRIKEEIRLRSIGLLNPGHGWTHYPFGIENHNIETDDYRLTDEYRSYFAEINGKRELFNGKLNFTQLCYSNPKVRTVIADAAVEYCKKNPEITLLRFTLADGTNNFCECENCRTLRPSDWLMMILNEMDEKLTAAGLDTRVSFSAYVDLLWAPTKVKLNNPSRFYLNLSPSSRTYSRPLYDMRADPDKIETPPFELNKLTLPRDVETIIAFFKKWREWTGCECTLFDYQLMWDHYLDPGYTECAKMLHKDVTGLDKLGFVGYISCQEQRCAFPTALPMYAMARGLWDKNSRFEDVSREYYEAAFGEDWREVEGYLAEISRLFDPAFMRNDHVEAHFGAKERMDAVDALIDSFFAEFIEKKRGVNDSWNYLWYHAAYCKMYAELVRCYIRGDETEIDTQTKAFTEFHFANQRELHNVLDNFYFDEVYQRWIKRVFANKPTTVDF